MVKKARTKKYFAPQNEGEKRKCDHPGCQKHGEYRAPKDKTLKEYYWFCLEHVQEYNAKWNYYDGEKLEEEAQKTHHNTHFRRLRSKVKYAFGKEIPNDFGLWDEYMSDYDEINHIYYSQEEKRYLQIMEMAPQDASLELLKKQYKKLVKKYHPDVNQGDKDCEEKFKAVSTAYKFLLNRLS